LPSIGRKSLKKTLHSLQRQTDSGHNAIVVWDGLDVGEKNTDIDPNMYENVSFMSIEKVGKSLHSKGSAAGAVRNAAIPYIKTDWTAFVDDDDTLLQTYVSDLRDHVLLFPEVDIFVFRAVNKDMAILPPAETTNTLYMGKVGIYFAIRTSILKQQNFIHTVSEDWDLLHRCSKLGYNIRLSACINYALRFYPIQETQIDQIHLIQKKLFTSQIHSVEKVLIFDYVYSFFK
jgi:glycosyltransferase involved in cell wall biosynthesis